ncbi:MAG: hypothetical protein ACYCOO_10320 [Chitinophagaceae bacterium]
MGIVEQLAEIKANDAMKIGLKKGFEEGFKKGFEEGRKEGEKRMIKILLTETELSAEKIASMFELPLSYVKKLNKTLSPENLLN